MSKEQKMVTWFFPKKAMIKFDGDDEPCTVDSKVFEKSDFEKYPVRKGDVVEYEIDNNVVTFIKKVKAESKKEEPKTKKEEQTDTPEKEFKTLTVEAVFENESIKFKEENINNYKWTKVSDELKEKGLKTLGVIASNKVKIELQDGKIVGVETVEVATKDTKEENTDKPTQTKKTSFRDEDSTDKRTCLMVAKDIVITMINQNLIEKTTIKTALEDLAKTSYKILQDL